MNWKPNMTCHSILDVKERMGVNPTENRMKKGVYVLVDKDGRPLYVGKSTNLSRRISEHEDHRGVVNSVSENLYRDMVDILYYVMPSHTDDATLHAMEQSIIAEYDPPCNYAKPGKFSVWLHTLLPQWRDQIDDSMITNRPAWENKKRTGSAYFNFGIHKDGCIKCSITPMYDNGGEIRFGKAEVFEFVHKKKPYDPESSNNSASYKNAAINHARQHYDFANLFSCHTSGGGRLIHVPKNIIHIKPNGRVMKNTDNTAVKSLATIAAVKDISNDITE